MKYGSSRNTIAATLAIAWLGCSDSSSDDLAEQCVAEPLPLQNSLAFPLGETYYLPQILDASGCPSSAAWEVASAPTDSVNTVYQDGAPEPRFTPDSAGEYVFRIPSIGDAEHQLTVVARTPAERFRNHYLTPHFGAAQVGDELWTANGASYTVSRLVETDGELTKAGEVTVGSWPAAIAWRDPLPYGVVALRGSDTVGFIDRQRGMLEDALWVGDEPTGLAISPDASTLYVSLATMREIAVVDLAAREVSSRIAVGFDPRALALSGDGTRLFVASYRSRNPEKDLRGTYGANEDQDIHIIDTSDLSVTQTIPGVSAAQRAIALSEDGTELYVAATNGDPIPSQGDPTALPFVHELVVLGADASGGDFAAELRRTDLTRQTSSVGPVVNPAGVVQSGDTVWVAAESSNLVVALDRQTLEETARVEVGDGPRQLIALGDGSVAVHCFQSFELWVISPAGQVTQTVALTDDPRPPEIALGEDIFSRPGNGFADNHACSNCHIEAQNEGQIWSFAPERWSNARPLQLLGATTPTGWNAYIAGTANFGYAGPTSIIQRPVSPEEATGMQRFLDSLVGAPRANSHTRLDGSYTESALRGKELFEGKASCAGCHTAPLYTNRTLIEVGKSGEEADVPTLLGVYRHGIYFINGQSRTLEDAVDVALDYVSVTLESAERDDLIDFLRQLTVKGAAPLAIWPDIDSNQSVYPNVVPFIELGDLLDDSPGSDPLTAATEHLVLEDADGNPVPSTVSIAGNRIALVPDAPLTAGASYRFRVLEGLRFRSGGVTDGELVSAFSIANPANATLGEAMTMTVTLGGGPGGPTPLPFALTQITEGTDAHYTVVEPIVFGTQQRQSVWIRIDGDDFIMQDFAMPIPPNGAVANVFDVVGTVTEVDGDNAITQITGTLRLTGPGIDIPNIPFEIGPPAGPPVGGPPASN